MDSTDMNIISSLLLYIGEQISALKIKVPRSVLAKGTQYTDKTLYGAYGFVGANKTATIFVPVNLPSNVTQFDSSQTFKLLVSMRTINNKYLGGDGTAGNVNLTSSVTGQALLTDQALMRFTVQNNDFDITLQHTPIAGQIQVSFKLS